MKIYLVLAFCFPSLLTSAQEAYDTIGRNQILINDKYHLHASKEQLSELLKKADTIKKIKAEMEFYCNEYSEAYFKKSSLTICDDKGLVQFDLYDNYFRLSIKSHKIAIGMMLQY